MFSNHTIYIEIINSSFILSNWNFTVCCAGDLTQSIPQSQVLKLNSVFVYRAAMDYT